MTDEKCHTQIFCEGLTSIIEIKLVHPHDGREAMLRQGLKQISRYADKVGRDATQTLAIFDRTPAGRAMPWEERLRREAHGDVVVRWL